jgi:hypothetical protein
VADEREDKPAEDSARETAVGHQVVSEDAAKDEGATEVFFSRDEPQPQPQPAAAPQSPTSGGTSPAAADRQAAQDADSFSEKPELFIGGAFVGAFVFAKLLKKLTGSDG